MHYYNFTENNLSYLLFYNFTLDFIVLKILSANILYGPLRLGFSQCTDSPSLLSTRSLIHNFFGYRFLSPQPLKLATQPHPMSPSARPLGTPPT